MTITREEYGHSHVTKLSLIIGVKLVILKFLVEVVIIIPIKNVKIFDKNW